MRRQCKCLGKENRESYRDRKCKRKPSDVIALTALAHATNLLATGTLVRYLVLWFLSFKQLR